MGDGHKHRGPARAACGLQPVMQRLQVDVALIRLRNDVNHHPCAPAAGRAAAGGAELGEAALASLLPARRRSMIRRAPDGQAPALDLSSLGQLQQRDHVGAVLGHAGQDLQRDGWSGARRAADLGGTSPAMHMRASLLPCWGAAPSQRTRSPGRQVHARPYTTCCQAAVADDTMATSSSWQFSSAASAV